MTTICNRPERRNPIFGIGSFGIPIIGFLIGLCVAFLSGGAPPEVVMYRFFMSLAILMLTFEVGALSALIAIARRERYWGLALAGFIFDVCPVLGLIIWNIHPHQ